MDKIYTVHVYKDEEVSNIDGLWMTSLFPDYLLLASLEVADL